MILNLVENAIHHTPPGSTIEVATGVRGPHAIIVVSDDGPGVPPEHREQIFDRFYRASGDRGRTTGLGLAIVQAVAQGHGGVVTLEDAAPGARFVVRLPATSAAALPEPGSEETAVAVPAGRGTWAFAVRLSRRRP